MISMAILTVGCNLSKDELQQIKISAGKINIPVFDNDENFSTIMLSRSLEDLVYIKNKETILIEFDGKEPSTISLTEHILNENGSPKFATETEGKVIDIKLNKSKASFEIEPNFATSLSSNANDFNPGATIKGYRLVCSWEKSDSEYFFVIRGDAAITNE